MAGVDNPRVPQKLSAVAYTGAVSHRQVKPVGALAASSMAALAAQTRRTVHIMFWTMLGAGQRAAQLGGEAKADAGQDFRREDPPGRLR